MIVTIIGSLSFFGYNEYVYRKVGVCFSEGNLNLAENYIDSVSSSYKDFRKIKALISTVRNHNEEHKSDAERTFSRLIEFKGFQNENVNQYYNHFLFEIHKELTAAQIKTYLDNDITNTGPGSETSLSNHTTIASTDSHSNHASDIVYYVENSEVYHITPDCSSLSRSTNVLSGTIPEGRRACKICS